MKFITKYSKFLLITHLLLILLFSINTNATTQKSTLLAKNNLQNSILDEFSQNNILFYDPSACETKPIQNGTCGAKITGTTWEERLRQIVENYGIFFMNAQIEYGVPWEIPIVHAHAESHFGLAGSGSVNKAVEDCGYYNWMGFKLGASLFSISKKDMGNCLVYHSEGTDDGNLASQYKNIADMFSDFYTGYLRNGLYDEAYEYATPNSFDARKFLEIDTLSYCGKECGPGYLAIYDMDIEIIHEIAKEKGWPTSKELMKKYDIPKGGNWSDVWGNISRYIDAEPGTLSVGCNSMQTLGDISGMDFRNNKSTSDTNNSSSRSSQQNSSASSVSGSDITWIGDSYSVGAKSIIEKKFSGISFGGSTETSDSYIQSNKGVSDRYGGGKANPPALTILKDIVDNKKLKSYLVMVVGTNAGWDDNEVDEFKKIISPYPDTKVVFVTAKARAHLVSDDNGTNQRLKDLVDSNKNYYLADWAAAYDDKYFASDSTHPTSNGGYEKWVDVIADALSDASGTGCTTYEGDYPQYSQCGDDRWSTKSYPYRKDGSGSICSGGCGPSSMAMLTTVASGKDVFPNDIVDLTLPNGTYVNDGLSLLDQKVAEEYGLDIEIFIPTSNAEYVSEMREYLKKGYMLHILGGACLPGTKGVTCPFSSTYPDGAHYVGIFGFTDSNSDTVMVADSAGTGNKEYNLEDIVNSGIYGPVSAIKGSGSNGFCSTSYCSENGNTSTMDPGGLTNEQAQKIAHYYNHEHTPIGCCGLKNCVEFSNFYLTQLTTYKKAAPGNGDQIVPNLIADGVSGGSEPKSWAVFSKIDGMHTGVIVGSNDDGTFITVEAAHPGWMDGYTDGDGNARVYSDKSFSDGIYKFAYFDDKLNNAKINEILNE